MKKIGIPEKQIPFYVNWVNGFFASANKGMEADVSEKAKEAYLHDLGKKLGEWQVKQAKDAIDLFLYFRSMVKKKGKP